MERHNRVYKVLVIGDTGVGKTSLLFKFLDTAYSLGQEEQVTVGVEFSAKGVMVDNTPV